jgi:hypothetical protein
VAKRLGHRQLQPLSETDEIVCGKINFAGAKNFHCVDDGWGFDEYIRQRLSVELEEAAICLMHRQRYHVYSVVTRLPAREKCV